MRILNTGTEVEAAVADALVSSEEPLLTWRGSGGILVVSVNVLLFSQELLYLGGNQGREPTNDLQLLN